MTDCMWRSKKAVSMAAVFCWGQVLAGAGRPLGRSSELSWLGLAACPGAVHCHEVCPPNPPHHLFVQPSL
jgi:hypothetical protein